VIERCDCQLRASPAEEILIKHEPNVEQLGDFFGVRSGHKRASVGMQRHESVRFEQSKRLSNGNPADTETAGNVFLA